MKKLFTVLFLIASTTMLSNDAFAETSTVDGIVRYNNDVGTPLKGVTVTLYDASGSNYAQTTTDGSGKYRFENVPLGSYTLDVSGYIDGWTVDLSDSYLISSYLSGMVQLTELQIKSADINEDGKVDGDDCSAIYNDYLLYGEGFSFGKIVFIPKVIEVTGNSTKAADGASFAASAGDVDVSFDPILKTIPHTFKVNYDNEASVTRNQLVEIPIYLNEISAIGGFALSLRYPHNSLIVESLTSQMKDYNYHVENGEIQISFQDITGIGANLDHSRPLITLFFRANSVADMSGLSNITFNKESHIIDANGIKIKNFKMTLPSFSAIGGGVSELNNIFPNPIYNTATINYKLTSSYKVKLYIYNTIGQLVTTLVDNEQVAGNYSVNINADLLHLKAGSYIYRLECLGASPYTESKIMIVR